MTLKEKFHQWLRTEPFSRRDAISLREAQCEVIADEYALEFGKYILDYGNDVTSKHLPSILEEFKKEKGL